METGKSEVFHFHTHKQNVICAMWNEKRLDVTLVFGYCIVAFVML